MADYRVKNAEAGLRSLAEVGFCIHENAFSADEVARLRDRLDEQANQEIEQNVAVFENGLGGWRALRDGAQRGPIQVVEHLVNKGRAFLDVPQKPLVKDYLHGLMPNGRVNLAAYFGFVVHNGAVAQPLHVDQAEIGFETPVPVGAHVLLCLSDFDEDMGATRIVPGSHRDPLPKLEFDPATGHISRAGPPVESIAATGKAGSLIIYDTRLHHGRGASSSDKVRYSVSMGFNYAWRTSFYNHAAVVHDDVYKMLTPEDLTLLGIDQCATPTPRFLGPRFPGDFRGGNVPFIPELHSGGDAKVVEPAGT